MNEDKRKRLERAGRVVGSTREFLGLSEVRFGRKAFDAMSSSELAEATAAHDQEMAVDRFMPLTETARRRREKSRRKPGRPRRGKGAGSS
ncbi:MAG: hypothetical protein ACM3SU_02585 [Acidobacteriota bacterium]